MPEKSDNESQNSQNEWIPKPKPPLGKIRRISADIPVENTSFVLSRDSKTAKIYRFRYSNPKIIDAGHEGKKVIADVSSKKGEHGRYFIKSLFTYEDGKKQRQKWQYFKNHGVEVPDIFKPIIIPNKSYGLAVQDLSQEGRYMVLSSNDPETYLSTNINLSKRISPQVREKFKTDLIHACEVAAGQYDKVGENPEGTIYELQADPFMLVINPNDPDDSRICMADFGVGVMEKSKVKDNQASILERNIRSASFFYTLMTGEFFQLPDNHPLAEKLKPFFTEELKEIIRIRELNEKRNT